MKIYNPEYQTKAARYIIGDMKVGYCVKYRRKGWFQRWHRMMTAHYDEEHYQEPVVELTPIVLQTKHDAKKMESLIRTEAWLTLWRKKQQAIVDDFWEDRSRMPKCAGTSEYWSLFNPQSIEHA